jgi:Arc/MetJ-type ribon-helix-helix transcriptional regulator
MPTLRSVETKPVDEKITINLGVVDLGQIDLLVQEGFYGNRTDLIRTAIRNQLAAHADAMRQAVARRMLVLGIQHFSADQLRAVKAAKQKLQIRVLGLATIAADVTPALGACSEPSTWMDSIVASASAVKNALADRIR